MRGLVFLCAGVLVAALAGCGKPDVKAILEESRQLAQKGDNASWTKIRKNLENVLRNSRLSPQTEGADRIHNLYVQSLLRVGTPKEARLAAENAQKLFPDSYLANYQLGKVHYDQGDMPAATASLEQALKLKPDDANTLTLLVVAAAKSNSRNAGAYFAKAADLPEFKADSRLYNEWALWLVTQNKPDLAIAKMAEAIRQPNCDPAVYMNFGILWDRYLDKPAAAKKYYKKYLIEMTKFPDSRQDDRILVQNRLRDLRE